MQPELAWGVFERLVGLVYLIAFLPLHREILALCGSQGATPVRPLLQRMRRDFPFQVRLWHFPSLLWVSSSDRSLRALPLAGSLAAVLAVYGGPFSRWALLACFVVALSLDKAVGFSFPWDSVLMETGFIALFLPSIEPLPSLAAGATPLPIVAFALELLLVRVLVGFGKIKFVGTTGKDHGYLREFLINQPMPTPAGWRAHHWPGAFHRMCLLLLFLGEVPFPLLAVVPGPARLVPFVTTMVLMLGIQLTGNFGFFNVIVAVLCVPLLDLQTSIFSLSTAQVAQHPLTHAVMAVLFVGWLVFFPFNSWCSRSWTYWPFVLGLPNPLKWLVALYRNLESLRVVSAYGVFPPQTAAAVKFVPIFQGSHDGRTWSDYVHRYMPTDAWSRPPWVAPIHPRWDQLLVYAGYGMTNSGLTSTLFNHLLPYEYTKEGALERVAQRLLEGSTLLPRLLHNPDFADKPPRFVRVVQRALIPTSPEEQRKTGRWWVSYSLGIHLEPMESRPEMWAEWLNGPELFHWDDVVWRQRAPVIRRLEGTAARAANLDELEAAVAAALNLAPGTLERLWAVTCRGDALPLDFSTIESRSSALESSVGRAAVLDLERAVGGLAIGLAARHEQRAFGDRCGLPSYLHFGMLMHHVILRGRDVFAQALADQAVLEREALAMTPASGLWLWALFRPGVFRYQALGAKLVRQFVPSAWAPIMPGSPLLDGFFQGQFPDVQPDAGFHISREVVSGAWHITFEPECREDCPAP